MGREEGGDDVHTHRTHGRAKSKLTHLDLVLSVGLHLMWVHLAILVCHCHVQVRIYMGGIVCWCVLQCMSLKGCLAASGAWDNTLRVWNIHVGMCKYTLQGHSDGEGRRDEEENRGTELCGCVCD